MFSINLLIFIVTFPFLRSSFDGCQGWAQLLGHMGICRLIGAEMKGCQVRDYIVGERDMRI